MKDTPTNPDKMSKRQLQQALAAAERRCEGRAELVQSLENVIWRAVAFLRTWSKKDAMEFERWMENRHCPSCNKRGGTHLPECEL